MDGITALALTVNVIQVVVWGSQAIDAFKNGGIDETRKDATADLKRAVTSLQEKLSLQRQPISDDDKLLLKTAKTCEAVADRFLKEVEATKNTRRLKRAIMIPLKQHTIRKQEKELDFCQKVLETQLLVAIRNNINPTAFRMGQNFDNQSCDVQNLVLKMEDGKTDLSQILDDQNERIKSLENQSADIETAISNLQLGTSFRKLDYDHPQVRLLLSSLFFRTLFSRRDQIPSTYPDTYEWALKSSEELKQEAHPSAASPNLLEWLQARDGLYWISGKAGSGKSTFMKFVSERTRMQTALNTWSGNSKAVVATHFFWSQGNELQRSRIGLLRSILYQLLSACPSLISFFGNEHHVGYQEWTESRLVDALFAIASQNTPQPLKFCLFVDGMDEAMGNPTELLDLLCDIALNKNIKCVISSRPWAIFSKRLGPHPQIRLQEFTEIDIHRFVSGKINAASSPVPLSENEMSNITDSLICKAEGVFLWVSLATASILDGIEYGEKHHELQQRINELPAELKELYRTIMTQIKERYRSQAMQIFTLLLLKYSNDRIKPSVLFMSCVDLGGTKKPQKTSSNKVVNLESVLGECNLTYLHLQQRCGGLLHFRFEDRKYSTKPLKQQLDSLEEAEDLRVEFLHRTVLDFFRENPEVLDTSVTESSYPWDPLVVRAEACIQMLEIKIREAQGPSKRKNINDAAGYLLIVLLSIRCVELDQCTAQRGMLERLDIQGRALLQLFSEERNFAPEVHWCVLLSPEHASLVDLQDPKVSTSFNSGNMTSLPELCAYSGLVQTALAELPQLSSEKRTAVLNCTLNGLTYPRDGRFQEEPTSFWVDEEALTPCACIEDDKFAIKDFRARASLILKTLQEGGCPNTGMVCVVRELESNGTLSGPRGIHEKFVTGETAWCHLLRMLKAEFHYQSSEEKYWLHQTDTVALWARLIHGFIEHHANPRQLVHNLMHIIRFGPKGEKAWQDRFSVGFHFESEPLPIVASYFQSNVLGQTLLNTIRQKGGQSKVRFKEVWLQAEPEFREIFTDIFGLDNPSHVANGTWWDVSNGALDDLGTKILSSNQPLWDTQAIFDQCFRGSISDWHFNPWGETNFDPWEVALQKKPRPHTLDVLREVFVVLNELQPRERLDSTIQNKSRAAGNLPEQPKFPKL